MSDSHSPTSGSNSSYDRLIPLFIEAAERLQRGEYDVTVPVMTDELWGQLGQALQDLANTLETRYQELLRIDRITSRINAGLLLDEILSNVYDDFRDLIPYNRIGFALIEDEGQTVRARWAKSDGLQLRLRRGYDAPLASSSLQAIIESGEPRILNDLEDYLANKPESDSTRLIVEEGIRSSLTCPLIANGVPIGFIFFSSVHPYAYERVHIDLFKRIAGQLSVMVEKGRLVSELAGQKNAIERQNRELLRLNELKSTFVGIAAHDLRSPLGSVRMALHFLMDSRMAMTEDERIKIMQDAADQTQYMLDLINDLLDVTQIESGRLELHKVLINLEEFLAAAIERNQLMAAQKGTHIVLDGAPPGSARADARRLRQVLDNLISNAIKFSPSNSTVLVAAESLPDVWRVIVQDEGPGIQPEERERLFQDFARLSARPTAGEGSTGLGLAISRRIVDAHGGTIGVESVPGHGATFWFTLPH